jgi:deoxyribose-phosphate aldolase
MTTAWSQDNVAGAIQHTLIGTQVTREKVLAHAQECVEYGFQAAMVQGSWLEVVAAELSGTSIVVASALDFPEVGLMTSAGKAAEAAALVSLGAQQIDIGVQIGWLKSGMFAEFGRDIRGVVEASGVPIKVMLELPLLTDAEKEAAIDLSLEAGVKYLKNASSGAIEKANPENISYLFARCPQGVGVKASGGISTLEHTLALLNAGAQMVGTSAGVSIVSGKTPVGVKSY